MKKVIVEVLDNTGCVMTTLQMGSAVEAVKNIAVGATMRVFTAEGDTVLITADQNVHDQTICVQIEQDGKMIGYMWPESFAKIYM